MFELKAAREADARLRLVRAALDLPLNVTVSERYEKIPSLWEFSLDTPATVGTPAEIVLHTLQLAGRLGSGWLILGPDVYEGQISLFDGVFNEGSASRPFVTGFSWGTFGVHAA